MQVSTYLKTVTKSCIQISIKKKISIVFFTIVFLPIRVQTLEQCLTHELHFISTPEFNTTLDILDNKILTGILTYLKLGFSSFHG